MTHKLTWSDLPAPIHAGVEELLGSPVAHTRTASGGFSVSSAEIVTARSGEQVFVKAVSRSIHPGSDALNRQEAASLARLPPGLPIAPLRDVISHEDWFALVIDLAPGQSPTLPWIPEQLDQVLRALDRLRGAATPTPLPESPGVPDLLDEDLRGFDRVAADPPADLDPWVAAHLGDLRSAAARGVGVLAGETLCHSDLRADNLLVTSQGQVTIVDWAWAGRGSVVADALQLLSSVDDRDGRLAVNQRIDRVMDGSGLPREAATDVLAGILGFFVDAARLPEDPALPTLRAHRVQRRDLLLHTVKERLVGTG